MEISTFELLVQPIAPKPFDTNVSRRVIQAYFLTIANLDAPGADDIVLSLQFTPTTELKTDETFIITDTGSGNMFGELSPNDDTSKPSVNITLSAGKTALVVLQPDISKAAPNPASLDVAKYEVRGYVEVFLSNFSPNPAANILVSPQVRGTFVPNDLGAVNPDFDQQAYSLPTPNGGSLITLP
ncbi:MAG: hypothetical protein AAFP20_14905 [Cyanobacteria bacterium J06614_10]